MVDDLRASGTVEVQCSAPGCDWFFWVAALDPRLPAGPFFCDSHDPEGPMCGCKCGCGCWDDRPHRDDYRGPPIRPCGQPHCRNAVQPS